MKLSHFALLTLSFLFFSIPVRAVPVDYELLDPGNGRYQYDYTINNELSQNLDGFTIYFDTVLYANFILVSSPDDWDSFSSIRNLPIKLTAC